MKRNEIISEFKKGVKAVKYNKKPNNPANDHAKAKEKLAPVKPLEGYNPNSASAEHRRKLDQSHAASLKAKAESPDASERDKQRYQNYLDKKEQMANDYNDRMEREGIEQEALYRRRGSSSAYDRDYQSSISGMGRRHDHRDLEHELGHETNNYAVAIDGRTWKVFASRNHAEAVARSLQNKGKNASVHETGAEPTAEATGAELGKITKVDPTTKKATLTKADGSSMEVDSTALKPTPDGKMSMDTPDADELKTGTAVVSTEEVTDPAVAPSEDQFDAVTLDSADGFKDAVKKAATASGVDAEDLAKVDNMIVADTDGTVDVEKTLTNMLTTFSDAMPELVKMIEDMISAFETAMRSPEFATLDPEAKQSVAEALEDMKKQLPVMQRNAQAAVAQANAANPELARIQELAGMKEADAVSPRFAGVQQTKHDDGSQTTNYQAGPMDVTNKVDAKGNPLLSKGKYDLGIAQVDSEMDHVKGIRSNAITTPGMDPNELLPTAGIAAARGVDPKKFAKFQQQNPSAVKSEALEAMLRIAGLR